jgi:hypothetical protein
MTLAFWLSLPVNAVSPVSLMQMNFQCRRQTYNGDKFSITKENVHLIDGHPVHDNK